MLGVCGLGISIPPASSGNLLPIVANSIPAYLDNSNDAAVPTIMAISDPGIFLFILTQKMQIRRHPILKAVS